MTEGIPTPSNFYDEMGEMAEMNLKEKEQPDLYLEQIGEELKNDPEMIGFNTPYQRT